MVNTGGRIFANGSVTGSNLSSTLLQDVTGVLLPGTVPKTGPITAPVVDVSRPLGQPDPLGQPVAPSPSGTCVAGTYASVGNCTSFNPGLYVLTGRLLVHGEHDDPGDRGDVPAHLLLDSDGNDTVVALRSQCLGRIHRGRRDGRL